MKYLSLVLLLLMTFQAFAQKFANHSDYDAAFEKSADSILAIGNVPSLEMIKNSLEKGARPVNITNKRNPSLQVLSATELYVAAKKATVMVGSAYRCPHCEHTHVSTASGYIIAESGLVVTNYHVVKGYVDMREGNTPLVFLVRLSDGRTYIVKEVLSASESDDLAVLQLEVGTDKIPAFALSEGADIGEEAYVLSHPKGMYYFFTKGMVNAKYKDAYTDREKRIERDMMAISADYAAGSSGGPIIDASGNIIGTVSSTRTVTYTPQNPSVQMVLKMTIPVESLHHVLSGNK